MALFDLDLTGATRTGTAGALDAGTAANVTVTLSGNSVAASIGTLTFVGAANVALSGTSAEIASGTVSAGVIAGRATAYFTDLGVGATPTRTYEELTAAAAREAGEYTELSVSATPSLIHTYGTTVAVALTGSSITASVGDVTVSGEANVSVLLSGAGLAISAGNVTASSVVTVELSGVSVSFSVGDPTITVAGAAIPEPVTVESSHRWYSECAICGVHIRSDEATKRWDGLVVSKDHPGCFEHKHPLDMPAPRISDGRKLPFVSPEGTEVTQTVTYNAGRDQTGVPSGTFS